MEGHALIVGAGIAGAAAGVALHRAGWSVELHDRAAGVPLSGTALGMWPEAMRALDAIDVGGRIRDVGIYQASGTILDPGGTTIARIDTGSGAFLVSRPMLLAALHANLPPGSVRWGSRLSREGDLSAADVVVAADGINSWLRDRVAGRHVPPRPLGTVAFRGVVPHPSAGVTETWGPGRLFGITPNTSATTNWFASVRRRLLPDPLHADDHLELLRELFAGWHLAIAAVLEELTPAAIDMHPLNDLPRLSRYSRNHTVLIGDAAHAMAPNLGRGACESIIDAVELATALTDAAHVEGGLRRYDHQRRRSSQRIVAASRAMNRISTTSRMAPVRDLIVRSTGSLTRRLRTDDDGSRATNVAQKG